MPDLADGEPEISTDNKTITVKIKKGIKFAPPVNREVKTTDIKYAIERAFSKKVPSGYAGAYFSTIVGRSGQAQHGRSARRSRASRRRTTTTIVFKLEGRRARRWSRRRS